MNLRFPLLLAVMAMTLFSLATSGCSSGGAGDIDEPDAITRDVAADALIDASDDSLDHDANVQDTRNDTTEGTDTAIPPPDDIWNADNIRLDAAEPVEPVVLPEGIRVKVGAYNLYGYNWAAPEHFGAFIKELSPDLMALVESDSDKLSATAAEAGYEHYCSSGGRSLMSKTPLAECVTIDLVDDRSLLRTETEIGGVTFAVYVFHISWNVAGNRQTRQFIDEIFTSETRSHVIIMGDFNDEVLSRQIDILGEQLADAFTAWGWYPGERITWPSQGFDDTEGAQTIDLIMFRKALLPIVLGADAVNMSPVLSDHKPVWAELLFPLDDTPFDDSLTTARMDPNRVFDGNDGDSLPNLLTNPGAEDGLNGWTATGGAVATDSRFGCSPHEGSSFFAGLPPQQGQDEVFSSLVQSVDLSGFGETIKAGTAWLNVRAHMVTCPFLLTEGDIVTNRVERYDDAETVVTFRDATGAALDHRFSGRRDTLKWRPWAARLPIPPQSASVDVELVFNKRVDYVGGIDSAVDDVYVSVSNGPAHHVLGGNLISFGLDEQRVDSADGQAVLNDGWMSRETGVSIGFNFFPPVSVSGRNYLFAGDPNYWQPLEAPAMLSEQVDIRDYHDACGCSGLAIRWGGWTRTNSAEGALVTTSLQLLTSDGQIWKELDGTTTFESEWLYQEHLTMIPRGITSVRLVMQAEVPVFDGFLGVNESEMQDDAAFADEMFIRPEKRLR